MDDQRNTLFLNNVRTILQEHYIADNKIMTMLQGGQEEYRAQDLKNNNRISTTIYLMIQREVYLT